MLVEADFGSLRLQVDVTFSAPWTVIYGPSGSGKSTLLRAMCGVLGTGSVEFARRDADSAWIDLTPLAVHHRKCSYAPQGGVLFPHLSVRQNVDYPIGARSAGAGTAKNNAIDMFGLRAFSEQMPSTLSGGEKQRVNLARAFAVPSPRLMLLDEPFTGLDRPLRDTLLPRMQALMAERKIPVISVTHDVQEALLLGAEVVRLADGKVMAQGPAAEVLAEERSNMLSILRGSR